MGLPHPGVVRLDQAGVHLSLLAQGCPRRARGQVGPSPEEHVAHRFLDGLGHPETRSEDTQRCQNLQLILISEAPLSSPKQLNSSPVSRTTQASMW